MSTIYRVALPLALACNLIAGNSLCQTPAPSPPPATQTPSAPKREVIRVHESRTNLLLFPTGEEVFSDALGPANADIFASGSAGTVLSIDNHRLVFHTGQLFLTSGKNTLTVGTRLANIRLNPDTTVVLDIHPHKPLRVAVLSGASPVHLKIKDRRTPIMLKAGEELYVSDAVLPPEQYKTSDPIDRQEASKDTESKGLEIIKRAFDARQLLAWHLTEVNKKRKSKPWHVLAAGDSEFTLLPMNTGVIHLRSGELFVFAPDYAIIETPQGEVHGDKGALFAVDTSSGNLRARALTGPGDVTVLAGNNKLPVPPGEEVMVSDHKPSAEETNPKDGVARRNPTSRALDDKLSVTVADFNILSLLVCADYLKPIKKPLWANEKAALEQLIRTAAAIETITQSKGGYTGAPRVSRPRQQRANPGQAI